MLKNILIFLAGAGIGAGVCYIVCRDAMEKAIEDETLECEEFYKGLMASRGLTEDEHPEEAFDEAAEAFENFGEAIKEGIRSPSKEVYRAMAMKEEELVEEGVINYSRTSGEEKPSLSELAKKVRKEAKVDKGPYTISIESFMNEKEEYDKVTITHHSDNVYVDELGEIMMGAAEFVGEEAYETLSNNIHGFDVLYVRNDRLSIDYEIAVDGVPYFDAEEAPEEPPVKKKTPRKKKVEVADVES
jgi:hypothetical protein